MNLRPCGDGELPTVNERVACGYAPRIFMDLKRERKRERERVPHRCMAAFFPVRFADHRRESGAAAARRGTAAADAAKKKRLPSEKRRSNDRRATVTTFRQRIIADRTEKPGLDA
jgi:hypothetical protein